MVGREHTAVLIQFVPVEVEHFGVLRTFGPVALWGRRFYLLFLIVCLSMRHPHCWQQRLNMRPLS